MRLLQSLTRAGRCIPLGSSPSHGVPCPSALAIVGAHFTRVCLTQYVAPSGFASPPDAFLLPRSPRPCFMPRTLVGFALRSIPLREEGARLSAGSYPHVVGSNGAWLPPHASPDSWVLLPSEVRCTSVEGSLRTARCSTGILPLQGIPPCHDGYRLPGASSLELRSGTAACAAPQSFHRDRAGSSP